MYAITRLKAARNAWYWAVHFWRRGTPYFKRFYDLKCGGSMQARAAAIAWRDEQIAQAEVMTLRDFHAQRRSNNNGGVPGVLGQIGPSAGRRLASQGYFTRWPQGA